MYKKGLALAIIVLFIAVSYQPIIAEKTIAVDKESDNYNVDFEEAKEYLFQTLIDISNNPEVKQFLNEHKHDLITRNNNNHDCKNAIQKIYSQNPKLLKSILFTKPKMTFEYLEINYNRGLEIVDILGEEESSKMVKSIKTNPESFYELKNIITNNKELSNKISVLKEMNNNLISTLDFGDHPIICFILGLLFVAVTPIFVLDLFILMFFYYLPIFFWWSFILLFILISTFSVFLLPLIIIDTLLDCELWPYLFEP